MSTKLTETPQRLTPVEIESLRENTKCAATNLWSPQAGRQIIHDKLDALCDMALALSAAEQRAEAMGNKLEDVRGEAQMLVELLESLRNRLFCGHAPTDMITSIEDGLHDYKAAIASGAGESGNG